MAARGRVSRRGPALLLLPALLALLLPLPSGAQFLLFNGAKQIIFGSTGLRVALEDPLVTDIVISGNLTLPSNWTAPPVITNRSLLIQGDPDKAQQSVLNFNQVLAAIVVGAGAQVEFHDLLLASPGRQDVAGSEAPYVRFKCEGVGAWPSLILLDGAEAVFSDVTVQFYAQIVWARCANFAAKVKFELEQVMRYSGVELSPASNATLLLTDSLNITTNVVDITSNATVGRAGLVSENVTMTCITAAAPAAEPVASSASGGGGGGFRWWYGVIIAVAVVAALGAALTGLLVWRHRRLRRRTEAQLKGPGGGPPPPAPVPTVLHSQAGSEDAKQLTHTPSLPMTQSVDGSDSSRVPPFPSGPTAVAPVRVPPNATSQGGGGGGGAGLTPQLSSDGKRLTPQGSGEGARLGGSDTGWRSNGSGSTHAEGAAFSSKSFSGPDQNDSGSLSRLGLPWRDVAELLRVRSSFSDMEVGPLIGRGSYGRVYKGRWKGAYVALKIIDHCEAAGQVMALREGALSHSVQHPNVITTYSVFLQRAASAGGSRELGGRQWSDGEEDAMEGVPERDAPALAEEQEQFATYIVLEYADRGTLEKAILAGRFRSRSSGLPDVKAIHRCLLDVAGGMHYLHSVGVLHGDLKAANVLLKSTAADARGFSCKLADFGMARLLESNRTHVSTHTYGTISYMPPELLREGRLTRAVDAFSFGVLTWELFAGQMLHAGLTVAQVFYKVCYEQQTPPPPEHMPSEYQALMARCWAEDPQARPSFSEVFETLQGIPILRGTPASPSRARAHSSAASSPQNSNELPPRACQPQQQQQQQAGTESGQQQQSRAAAKPRTPAPSPFAASPFAAVPPKTSPG